MNTQQQTQTRAISLRIRNKEGALQGITIFIGAQGEMIGVSDLPALEWWVSTKPEVLNSPAVKDRQAVTAPTIDDKTKMNIRFFSDETPCWFDGCEQMREEYKRELSTMEAKKCKTCEKGALIRKYLKLIEAVTADPEVPSASQAVIDV